MGISLPTSLVWSIQLVRRSAAYFNWSPISDLFSVSFASLTASSAVALPRTSSGTFTVLRPFLVSSVVLSK